MVQPDTEAVFDMMPAGAAARARWACVRTAVGGVHVGQVKVREFGGDYAALLVVVLDRQPVLHAQRRLPGVRHRSSAVCITSEGPFALPSASIVAHISCGHDALQTSRTVCGGCIQARADLAQL